MNVTLSTTLAVLLLVSACSGQVLINECVTNATDFVEIVNVGNAPVLLDGYELQCRVDPSTLTVFTFPTGTVIDPSETIIVAENATNPSPPVGTQVFLSSNIAWTTSAGSCGLADASGAGIDLVWWNGATNLPDHTPASPFTGALPGADVYSRNGNVDTDTDGDWVTGATGLETPGVLNVGQSPVPEGPLTAAFTSSVTSSFVGFNVSFFDLSAGVATAWSWDFDGDTVPDSTDRHPTFSYAVPGTYDVSLTVTNSFGSDSITSTGLITIGGTASVVAPYTQDFDSGPLGGEWMLVTENTNGALSIGTDGDPSPLSGGDALISDAPGGSFSTNTATLVVDLAATGGGRLKYYFKETSDEDHAEDGVFLSDGVTTILINNHQGGPSVWTEYTIDLTLVAQTGGVSLTSSNMIIFSQRDNFATPTDGAFVDDVRVLLPPVPDTGQANQTLARLDINGGLNLNGNAAIVGENGPFFASGSSVDLTVNGEANQPYTVLFSAVLMRNNAGFPFGQIDLGNMAPDFSDIQVVLDGAAGQGFFDQFAVTDGSWASFLSFGLAGVPPGLLGAFQCLVYNSGSSVVGLTAAFEFTVTP